jgi:hypothetical protein
MPCSISRALGRSYRAVSHSKKRRVAEPGSALTIRAHASAQRAEELASARRRALTAKGVLATTGACVFAVAMIFARHSFAGHPKQPTTALAASPRFVSIVRRNLLQAGVVAPAQAPPGAATAAS